MKTNMKIWEKKMLKKYGWYAHYVFDDDTCPYNVNIHSHGLNKYNHSDIQICFRLEKETAHAILTCIIDRIKNGEKFETGWYYAGIIMNYNIEFAEAEEFGRKVLRIIFPDENGDFHGKYKKQLDGCKSL